MRRTSKEPCALVVAARSETRLEELADDAVREVALEFAPSCTQHLEADGLSSVARGTEQARLADARRTLEQHEHSSPVSGFREQLVNEPELVLPLQQGGGRAVITRPYWRLSRRDDNGKGHRGKFRGSFGGCSCREHGSVSHCGHIHSEDRSERS